MIMSQFKALFTSEKSNLGKNVLYEPLFVDNESRSCVWKALHFFGRLRIYHVVFFPGRCLCLFCSIGDFRSINMYAILSIPPSCQSFKKLTENLREQLLLHHLSTFGMRNCCTLIVFYKTSTSETLGRADRERPMHACRLRARWRCQCCPCQGR